MRFLACIFFSSMLFFIQANTLDSLVKIEPTVKKLEDKVIINQRIGTLYIEEANYNQALNYLLKASQYGVQLGNDSLLISCYYGIGRVFFYHKNHEKAYQYFEKAYQLSKGKPLLEGDFFKRRGDIHVVNQQYDSAKIMFKKAEKCYLQSTIDSARLAGLYANWSITFDQDYVNNLDYSLKSRRFFGDTRNSYYIINEGNIGNTFKDIVRFQLYDSLSVLSPNIPKTRQACIEKGASFINHAIILAKNQNNIIDYGYYSGILSELQELNGDYKNALENFRTYYYINDSVYSQDVKNQLANQESQLEIEKKNRQIQLNQIQIDNQKKTRIGLLIGLFLVTVIGFLLYFQALARKRNNIKLQHLNRALQKSNETKTRLFSIISHDLRSPIANIISFLDLKEDNTLDETTLQQLNQKTKYQAKNLLDNMETMLTWSKSQLDHFNPTIEKITVADVFAYLKRFFVNETFIHFDFHEEEGIFVQTDINILQVMMQNLTSNAIKAVSKQDKPEIIWTYNKDHQQFIITDNGRGVDMDVFNKNLSNNKINSGQSGLGLHIIQDLAQMINCELTFSSEKGKGFKATITIFNDGQWSNVNRL
ncbi:MAG: tetratricopeptide repeat-containing sensor histidine kinase [Chitinophagales bacterium]|nr:tetratricopeptide repeat-containing sensor histidine kinase [Chitinophagales bacterium]MBX7225724.1 tetratricopeptide repeat-containing sensor histidine kinase [Chitinophagales bacterium]